MSEEIRPGRYRHFKGKEYEVLGVARHSETEEEYVVYRQLYGEHSLWVRPASMWNEMVTRDGKTQRRFTLSLIHIYSATLRALTARSGSRLPATMPNAVPDAHAGAASRMAP